MESITVNIFFLSIVCIGASLIIRYLLLKRPVKRRWVVFVILAIYFFFSMPIQVKLSKLESDITKRVAEEMVDQVMSNTKRYEARIAMKNLSEARVIFNGLFMGSLVGSYFILRSGINKK